MKMTKIIDIKTENQIKEEILDRLHDLCGVKNAGGYASQLPRTLNTEDVLKAINLDNYFDET